MAEKFQASDDDLPDIFYNEQTAPRSQLPTDREIAAQVHFPVIANPKSTDKEKQRKSKLRDAKLDADINSKVYVRLGKRQQMYDWLRSLEGTFPGMDDREQDFCQRQLAKFRKYLPERTKWVTRREYDWLKAIAARYIHLPIQQPRS